MSAQYNLSINKTVAIKSTFMPDHTTDNVVISGNFSNLPSLSKTYLIQDFLKSKGVINLAQLVDINDPSIKSCPKEIFVFIRECIALIRTFTIPKVHTDTFNFNRHLTFCLACPKLMTKSNQGCGIIIPFSKVRAFYKAEKYIEDLFNDIFRCAFNLGSTSTKKYNINVMFGGKRLEDLSELDKACYEATRTPFPTK